MHRMLGMVAAAALWAACGSTEPQKQDEEPSCPPAQGPTEHSGDIAANEVWTAQGSPHVVTRTVRLRDTATLTIEPCAEVLLAADQGIIVGHLDTEGTLVAQGTEKQPIRFRGLEGARWSDIEVRRTGKASFGHATLEGGGRDVGGGNKGATLHVRGDNTYPLVERLSVRAVVVRDSIGPGVFLEGNSVFSADSEGLTITASGSEDFPWPVVASPSTAGSVPPGSYTGNRRDELAMRVNAFNIAHDATWADRGVPYRVTGIPGNYVRVASRTSSASLTLEAGVSVRMDPGTFFWIGDGATTDDAPGTLRTLGTAQAPVVLTSASASPQPGDWVGISFRGQTLSPNNRIEHTSIEYAGGECLCSYYNCVPDGMRQDAAIQFVHLAPAEAFIQHTRIFRSAGHGIDRAWALSVVGDVTTSFLDTNAFEEVAGCKETQYAERPNVCADPPPCP